MEQSALARRLTRAVRGGVRFDVFGRGLYATDASIYQMFPLGVVVPRDVADVEATLALCREAGVAVLPRGGGTSQCGQTVAEAVVLDTSKYLRAIVSVDVAARTVRVQPGLVLEQLNRQLKPQGLFFPIDPSTANRATLGGMAGNNSSGARSIKYGNMVHNVRSIDAVLADGSRARFGRLPAGLEGLPPGRYRELAGRLQQLGRSEASEIAERFPKVLRRVGGYNLDALLEPEPNLAHLLVGSEGTLAFFTELELELAPLPAHRVLGVCHFPTFHDAMVATPQLVSLGPVAVELVDRTIIEVSREMPEFAPTIRRYVQGEPDALLLVEFAGEDGLELERSLDALEARMADLGYPGGTVRVVSQAAQAEVWNVRSAGLNIVSNVRGDGKPVSVIEDCAVPLQHLAEYTERLTQLFARHGTRGTWYAHASVGCLHVRPVLNMKSDVDVVKLRAIAEEAFALVRSFKGSHSGEHGDGIVRSEFHEAMFGQRLVRAFETVKDSFDPTGLFNPGKIVRAPKMDDRRFFRYRPGYQPLPLETALDWSAWGGFSGAVEMCNNNGACRKTDPGVMCPSFMVTQDEEHGVRGRANALRLALTGQLGPEALVSDAMAETMALCVGCKGCKRECPTGVDMARMKVEYLWHRQRRHGLPVRDRLVAYLPRLAPALQPFRWLLALRDRIPALAGLSERLLGLSARRKLPVWSRRPFRGADERLRDNPAGTEVVLLVDTFTNWFEPETARAALRVLERAGYQVHLPRAAGGFRPLCCGRTFLSVGLVDQARREAQRTLEALRPSLERGIPVVGLEPSCLLTLRDEFPAMLPGGPTAQLAASALLFEEFVDREAAAGRFSLRFDALAQPRVLLHGHCHQKAFGAMPAISRVLALVPGLALETVAGSCCGMAGTFGYQARHYDVSMAMAEKSLLPAVRQAAPNALLVADGFSCQHQILGATGKKAMHVASLLEAASR
ncbi:MAG: FAD-binding and (Fe-S)-binding domain-containing protein [Myxococcaceae bacterium]